MNKLFSLVVLLAALFFAASAQECKHARILGATWGLKDVTAQVAHEYNLGETHFEANIDTFGEHGIARGGRTLTVVYEQCQNVAVIAVKEGESVDIPQGNTY